jgi:hypothetical protein
MSILRAREADLQVWGQGGNRGRYDYTTEQYLMAEMLNDDFFGACFALLRPGDYITITDAEDQILIVRIDEVNKASLKVYLSKMERVYAMPVVTAREGVKNDPGLVYRWRPSRSGGHSVITARGEVFAVDFANRGEAERCIENCYDNGVFEAPHGHEVTERHVSKNAKIYQG